MNDETLALCLVVPRIPHADKIDLDVTLEGGLVSENARDSDGTSIVDHAVCLLRSVLIPAVGQNTARDSVFVDYDLRRRGDLH